MDNYLKENRNGIKYKEILFFLGRLDMARFPRHPILTESSAIQVAALSERFFSLKGETLNLWGLIINYQLSIIHCKVGFWLLL